MSTAGPRLERETARGKAAAMTHVIVIGAGLAGLSAAIGCTRLGWRVTLCERASAFAPVGAGLTISPSAQAGLRWLGVQAAFENRAEPPEAPVVLDWANGEALPPRAPAPHLDQVRRIARSDLHAILLDHFLSFPTAELRLGAELTAVRSTDRGAAVILADGRVIEGDLLLGADGARSAVRAALFGDGEPAFTGFVAWRFLLSRGEAERHLRGYGTSITTGRDALLTTYTIAQGRMLNCVAITRGEDWAAEGWSEPGDKSELAAHFTSAHADARALIELVAPESLFRWGLFDRPVSSRWSKGRIVLLGDAAHPILPFLAYGAGLAIEDAVVLTRALATFAPDQAFAAFERERTPRATVIHAASREQAAAFARTSRSEDAGNAPFFDPSLFAYDPASAKLSEALP